MLGAVRVKWRKSVEHIGVGALALAVGILAFVHQGVPAAEVDLNDGGVWVSNGVQKLVGHLNYESRTLDGGLNTTASSFDLSQFGDNVMVTGADLVQRLDTASVALADEASVVGIQFAHGGGTVLFADSAAGKVWSSGIESIGGFTPQADPLVEDLDLPRVAVGVQGDAFVVTADGVVRTVVGDGEDTVVEEVGSLGAELSEEASLSVVGDTLIVLDRGVIRTVDRAIELASLGEGAVLQQPSLGAPEALVASGEGLWRVPLDGGSPSVIDVPSGSPARPVLLNGCAYGLWSSSGYYLRDCTDVELNEAAQFPELAAAVEPVFRTNRRVLVINDLATGSVYLPLESMLKVDNWELITTQLEQEEEDKKEDAESDETEFSQLQEFSEEQNPPVARDDELGARPGVATTLPLLLNDVDVDGDVLTAVITSQPGDIPVVLAKDGRAARIEAPPDASGTLSFTYQASDGVSLSNEATVTVRLSPPGSNKAPEKIRSNTIRVSERASAEYSILPDWIDPDGDSLFLEHATEDEGLSVTWRPDGFVSVRDLGAGGPGRRSVAITVSDGTLSTTEELVVQVMPGSSNNPPVANNDHVVANVGETLTLRPLLNDTDPDGNELRLVEVGGGASGVDLKPDYVESTIQFTASAPGTQTIVYAISDGPTNGKGKIRVDVIDPAGSSDLPAAENDLALMSQTGVVVVEPLANDFDPAGGVLVIQGVSMGSSDGLNVEVVRHSLLRVTAPAGIKEPQTFEYSVSNGHAGATASVLVVPLATQPEIPAPVALPETMVVRAGDIVTVDVLTNDYSPADLPIAVRPELDVRSEPALGEFFLSGDQVRFRAGAEAGTAEAIYTVADTQNNVASSTVTISIRGIDDGNQRPAPPPVTARTFSGMTTRIPIPMDGIDPDGDSVELLGTGKIGPQRGSVKIEGNYLVYTASPVDPGTDAFTYRVADRFGEEADGVVRVGVAPAPGENRAPVAVPDKIAARPSTRLEIPATVNDIDPDGDEISIVAGSVAPVDERWASEATIKGQKISVVTPAEPGRYQFYYSITDGGGAPVVGVVTVTVDQDVPLVAPIARDDYVALDAISGLEFVEVEVLVNDADPDGVVRDLSVEVEQPATVSGGVVTVPLAEERQVLLYTLRDLDALTARAAIVVPGKHQVPPMLDPAKIPAVIKGGDTLTIDLDEYVLTRASHTAKLTAVDSVVAGPGGSTEDPDLGLKVLDDTTIVFTPDASYHAATSVSFEVTDGDSVDDPRGLTATLNLPIVVESSGLFPPELRPGEVKVAPGEGPMSVSLSAMVDDPDPGDNEKMAFAVVSASDGVAAAISGQEIAVSVPAETPVGTSGSIVVSVHDGSTDPLEMTLPVTVIRSTRPLMSVIDVTEPEGRVGVAKIVNLADVVANPFADQGGAIQLVGQPSVAGPADVSVSGLEISVKPRASGANDNAAEDVVVSYTVADATLDSSRHRTGTIRVVVKDVPLSPVNVTAEAVGSRTARVTWSHSGWRGGAPEGFTVSWAGGSKDCGLQTSCDIDTLANNNTYTFTVTARVTESDIADSPASSPSNAIFVDAMPDAPAAPVATFGDRQIGLAWAATGVSDGGSPVTSYTVEIMPADASGRTRQVISGTVMEWNKLVNGTAYTFTLTAHNRLTELDPRVTAPKGPSSAPEIPAGAPSNQGAPTVVKDKAAAGVAPRAKVSWGAPGNPNGDTSLQFQLRQRGTDTVLYDGSGTSSVVIMAVAAEDRTFEVRSSNKSGLWSEWSPASNSVRAFQPPGAPTGFTLTPTGDGTRVRFDFGAAAGNGARPGEIGYRWSVGGTGGTITAGDVVSSPVFALGSAVSVQLVAVSTVNGETAEGPAVSATASAYAPPAAPSVSASGNANDVSQTWSMPATSNGRPISTVQLEPGGNVGLTGSRSQGNGRNQQQCIRARAQNSEGQWSDWSANACASTWASPKATEWKGDVVPCRGGFTAPCTRVMYTLERWDPNSYVTCQFHATTGASESPQVRVDSSGRWEGQMSDWIFGATYSVSGDMTSSCRQS